VSGNQNDQFMSFFLKSSNLNFEYNGRVQTIIVERGVLIFVGLKNGNGMI